MIGGWRNRMAPPTGWKRNALAFSSGVLATLTLAPFYLFPLIIPAFSGLYWLLNAAPTPGRAFRDGWWWGWGFYMSGLYWFCVALLTDAEKFAWLIPFALFALTAVIAVYCGIACWLLAQTRTRGLSRIFTFSALWLAVEFARGHLFTGFPWNLAGYSFGFSDAALQMASLIGAYGLTWFTVILGCSAMMLACGKRGRIAFAIVWGIFAIGMGWGQWRLHEANAVAEEGRYVPGVVLRLVQANNPAPPHNFDAKMRMQGLDTYIKLTQQPGLTKVTHVVWPESAVPFPMQAGSPLSHMLGDTVPEGKILITGGIRTQGEGADWQVWNSMVAFNHGGSIVGTYDKVKLVPFGEFLPFRWLLPKAWLTPVGAVDMSSGNVTQVLEWPGLPPHIPLICYEAIFPDLPVLAGERPQFLLNVTNDAWFGESSGPHQHFQMARMRAVERGIPLVRAANTGISAVVDGYGQVVAYLPLGTQGFLDSKLPKARPENTTYYNMNRIFIAFILIIAFGLILRSRRDIN